MTTDYSMRDLLYRYASLPATFHSYCPPSHLPHTGPQTPHNGKMIEDKDETVQQGKTQNNVFRYGELNPGLPGESGVS